MTKGVHAWPLVVVCCHPALICHLRRIGVPYVTICLRTCTRGHPALTLSLCHAHTEFESSAKSGTFLEWHRELFKHPQVSRLWGVTPDAIKEVIHAGRLPLIECETEGAEMLKKRGIDCLTIFLKPPSVEVFEVGTTDKHYLALPRPVQVYLWDSKH